MAQAHLVQTGFGTFYDGAAHLFFTPADVLVVLGLSLLAGLRGVAVSRDMLVALPAAWLAGGLFGAAIPMLGLSAVGAWLTTCSFAIVGLLVAMNTQMPRGWAALLGSMTGLLHGYVDGLTLFPEGSDWLSLIGVVTMTFVLVALVSALVVSLRAYWMRVAVRVAGSWIAAVGLLMIGWLVRGGLN